MSWLTVWDCRSRLLEQATLCYHQRQTLAKVRNLKMIIHLSTVCTTHQACSAACPSRYARDRGTVVASSIEKTEDEQAIKRCATSLPPPAHSAWSAQSRTFAEMSSSLASYDSRMHCSSQEEVRLVLQYQRLTFKRRDLKRWKRSELMI